MIPCKLTLYSFYKDPDSGDQMAQTRSAHGLAETPPILGKPFVMMTPDNPPKVVKTGIISTIEWSMPSKDAPKRLSHGTMKAERTECIFYTDYSTYRWERMGGEEDACPTPDATT